MREKRAKRDDDIHNFCFICNLERHIFDRHGEGFDLHHLRDHNVWNYVYFIYSIQMKAVTELNGIESYVYEKVSLSFIELYLFIFNIFKIKDQK